MYASCRLLLIAGLGLGCQDAAILTDGDEADGGDLPPDDDGDLEGDGEDDDLGGDPAYWSLDGLLVLEEGQVDLEQSYLAIGLADGEETLCDEPDLSLLQAEPVQPPNDLPVLDWWLLELEPGDTCTPLYPSSFHLGLGAVDSRLYPAMDRNGLEPEPDRLYGLFIEPPHTPAIFVFGVGGTEAQFDGQAYAATDPPLPDGVHLLEGLYLLPLDVEDP